MKKLQTILIGMLIGGLLMAGCSGGNSKPVEPELTANEMVDEMLAKVEQPAMMELPADQVKDIYHIDPETFEEYAIRIPMMNVKTNEVAVMKVKNSDDVPKVEEAVKQRAEDVQKQFESYLPDQYEIAKNYQVVTKGDYVLFVISDQADELVNVFESFFNKQ